MMESKLFGVCIVIKGAEKKRYNLKIKCKLFIFQ